MSGTPASAPPPAADALVVRAGVEPDYAAVNDIYNHYVRTSAVTFETEAVGLAARASWFAKFAATGAFRLLVAEDNGGIVGFACSRPFRNRPAYATSVETSVYVDSHAQRRGAGGQLYDALFAAIAREDLHRAYAALALPNDASVALHRKFGFRELAVLSEAGRKFGKYWDILWMERALR
jgi:phosphinothricin acetyltransferase